MGVDLMFEAGRVAVERGWEAPEIVSLSQIGGMSPTGPSAIAIGETSDVDMPMVRTLAALAGAGRDVVLITDQPLADELSAWLPARGHYVAGTLLDVSHESRATSPASADGTRDATRPTIERRSFRYCGFLDESSLAPFSAAQNGWVLEAWQEFVHRHSLTLTDQGESDRVATGSWSLGDDGYVARLWFQPIRSTWDVVAEFVLVGSAVAIVENPATEVTVPDSEWQEQFADQVVSWCEQPQGDAVVSRPRGQISPSLSPAGRRKGAAECFALPRGSAEPDRILSCAQPGQVLAWNAPTTSMLVPMSGSSRSLTFVYRVPAYRDAELFDSALCHAVDSLVRIHELLSNPATGLNGRRDPRLGDQLQFFMQASGMVSYGALARMERASEPLPDAGSTVSPEGALLSRVSAVVAEAMETLRDSENPAWQRILEYGDIGFPAASMYQRAGKWPTPQERTAILQVYRVLCKSLSLDAEREWVSFEEMLDANIAAHSPLAGHDTPSEVSGASSYSSAVEEVCAACGLPTQSGDRFCGSCGGALLD